MNLEDIRLEEIYENFDLLDDWEQKYMYLIELGQMIPEFNLKYKTPENLVEGCTSRVWLQKDESKSNNCFFADSESQIVKGLVALTLIIFNGKTKEEIDSLNEESIFARVNLEANLSSNRANGLRAIVKRIKQEAK